MTVATDVSEFCRCSHASAVRLRPVDNVAASEASNYAAVAMGRSPNKGLHLLGLLERVILPRVVPQCIFRAYVRLDIVMMCKTGEDGGGDGDRGIGWVDGGKERSYYCCG